MTTFAYEGDRLVRAVTVREPEFTADVLDELLAWLRENMVPRGAHGHPISEATSADADPSNWRATRRYVARLPRRDFAQKALDDAVAAYAKQYPDADTGSLLWSVESVEVNSN